MISNGQSSEELSSNKIFCIHPSFRIIALAEPPSGKIIGIWTAFPLLKEKKSVKDFNKYIQERKKIGIQLLWTFFSKIFKMDISNWLNNNVISRCPFLFHCWEFSTIRSFRYSYFYRILVKNYDGVLISDVNERNRHIREHFSENTILHEWFAIRVKDVYEPGKFANGLEVYCQFVRL